MRKKIKVINSKTGHIKTINGKKEMKLYTKHINTDYEEYHKEEMEEMKELVQNATYMTFKTFKGMSTKIVVNKGLTEKEAQAEVQKDIEINPKAENYMLVYTKETNKI